MDKYGEYSKVGMPQFDGINYAFWSIHMKLFLQSHGLDVWIDVENRYTRPTTTIVASETERRIMESNAKVKYALLGDLIGS